MSTRSSSARKRTAPIASIPKDEQEIEDNSHLDPSLHGDGSQMDEEYIMKRQRNNAAVNKTR